jgi:hypothetical protein
MEAVRDSVVTALLTGLAAVGRSVVHRRMLHWPDNHVYRTGKAIFAIVDWDNALEGDLIVHGRMLVVTAAGRIGRRVTASPPRHMRGSSTTTVDRTSAHDSTLHIFDTTRQHYGVWVVQYLQVGAREAARCSRPGCGSQASRRISS